MDYNRYDYRPKRPNHMDPAKAVWEHQVKRQAIKGWRWLILGPVAGIFAAVAVALLAKG